jgi:hypothetical protein
MTEPLSNGADKWNLKQSAGWISPEGRFYPCKSWEHDSFAIDLAITIYGFNNGTKCLEEKGWIRLMNSGYPACNLKHSIPTQSQLDTLWDIFQVSTGDFQQELGHWIEEYRELRGESR